MRGKRHARKAPQAHRRVLKQLSDRGKCNQPIRGAARQVLLHLGHLHKMALVDEAAHLAHERDVLGNVAGFGFELGVVLHEALHVRNRLNVLVALGGGLELVHHALDGDAQVAWRSR